MTTPASVVGGATFDLVTAERELRQEENYARNGHAARTLIVQPDLRIVLVVMRAAGRIAKHRVDQTASIHALKGQLRLQLDDKAFDVPAGQLLVLEAGLPHDVEAIAESTFLLTLGWSKA
jgi:quercetin dioxygenase-like cupin family protein